MSETLDTSITAYHGGCPKLRVGDYILPPDETKARSTAEFGAAGVCRTDRIYFTTDLNAAAMYAAMHPSRKGCVYRIEPEGKVEADTDCTEPGLSYSAERGRIVQVILLKGATSRKIRRNMSRLA